MNADHPATCPRCGARLLDSSPESLCPACLMSRALAAPGEETIPIEPGQSPPLSPRGLLQFPCVFGDFRLLGLLGRGGMGAVYEAEQIPTGRRVALKILEHELDSQEMRQRFLREGRLAATVSHPNNVYIFGTEELAGQPVIVMEVADGGTLKDLLKRRGPLPIAEAVDAILDVIAGLEAALAGGVLHRDVKPSNCFLTPDGSVKVGDFGLSVSTMARTDTFLTASGVMLGTPSYAPPEQLRGDELDVRADIYSVGATLFTLLTGKAPFEGDNAVQVVASVLNVKPTSIQELRPDVPAGLAQAVARCLAKKPDTRFPDYKALRNALLPFGSDTPEPAPLSNRFLAGFIDQTLATLPSIFLIAAFGKEQGELLLSERTLSGAVPWILASLFYLLYHALPEGRWGASVGKAILGLRVARPGGRRPGIGRAFIRASIALLALEAGIFFTLCTTTAEEYRQAWAADAFVPGDALFLFTWWSLFLTMRKRNGFANVMDLASGTRVVRKLEGASRPATALDLRPLVPAPDCGSIGPYRVIEVITPDQLISAYDPTLRRHVWLRRREREGLNESRRELARPGRLRWLQSVTTDDGTWDAFEAPAGAPLRALTAREDRPSWESMRHWLHDLAEELDAATKDQSLPPELSLDQVWITTLGRAILLDEPWPSSTPLTQRFPGRKGADQQCFLSAVAKQADPTTIPLHARPMLRNLAAGTFEKPSFLAGTLRALLTKPAHLSRSRRAASIFTVPLLGLAIMVTMLLLIIHLNRSEAATWTEDSPDLPPLSDVLSFRLGLEPLGETSLLRAVDTHLAGHYDHLAEALAHPAGTDPNLPLDADDRRTLSEVLAAQPEVTPEELAQADLTVRSVLPDFLRELRSALMFFPLAGFLGLLTIVALIQIFSLMLFQSSPGQVLFGFAVVDERGERAGRLRLLGRWFLAWLPFLLIILALSLRKEGSVSDWGLPASITLAAVLMYSLGLILAIVRPTLGLHDEFTKCRLLPR